MELLGLLVAAQPEWPWPMRLDLVRQAWDEARHAHLAIRRLEELGGHIGMYPVERWLYQFVVYLDDPLEQLIALQRVTEGYALDLHRARVESLSQAEDPRSALVFDYIAADETLHVSIGNWILRLTADSPERQAHLLDRQKDLEAELMASIAWREDWAEEVFE
jgi:uncharacterized ferritin-like protein (DUF455 family)